MIQMIRAPEKDGNKNITENVDKMNSLGQNLKKNEWLDGARRICLTQKKQKEKTYREEKIYLITVMQIITI